MDHISKDSLQAYFEQQNDKEAASIVAAVIALLPSNTSWDEEEQENIQQDDTINGDNVLNNILLTKEVPILNKSTHEKELFFLGLLMVSFPLVRNSSFERSYIQVENKSIRG